MHFKELECVQNENVLLKKAMEEKDDYLNATVAKKESMLQKELKRIKFIEVKSNKEKEIKCEKL